MKEVIVKWSEEKSILSQFYIEKPKKGFDLRIYQATKKSTLREGGIEITPKRGSICLVPPKGARQAIPTAV